MIISQNELKPKMTTLSVIGTAGRNNQDKLSIGLYYSMVEKCKDIIQNHFGLNPKNIVLVSGGAAWADHVVVDLFLSQYVTSALLYLPCKWDSEKKQYQNCKTGTTANHWHKKFSAITNKNSLEEIDDAIKKGLKMNIEHHGFLARNTLVAKSEYMIAFSWSGTNEPEYGSGTADTWAKSNTGNKIHISLQGLIHDL